LSIANCELRILTNQQLAISSQQWKKARERELTGPF
jgi:hypothetical protein